MPGSLPITLPIKSEVSPSPLKKAEAAAREPSICSRGLYPESCISWVYFLSSHRAVRSKTSGGGGGDSAAAFLASSCFAG